MKFNGRYLLEKPAVSFADTVQIREVRKEGNRLYIYSLPRSADSHTFGGPMIEIYISSPLPDIIRIQAQHFTGSRAKIPQFQLNEASVELITEEDGDRLTVKSGNSRLEIRKNPAKFSFYYKERLLTSISNFFDRMILGYAEMPEGNFMRAQLDLDIGEKVYGLGERFTPFVKNGQSVDIWNEDSGTDSHLAYKNVPFYITNRGYGVFVNDTGNVSFEICSEKVDSVQFSVKGEKLDFMVIGGENMKAVISNYTALTGRPALPPAWSFGLWLTSSFTTSYDEKTVREMVDGMRSRGIPMSVFHFDCFWMRENEWCNFEWDKDIFEDPDGMLNRMKADGLKICVWINPYIGQKSPLFKEAMEHNYLLNRPNGDVWQWDMWQAGMGIVDFTNPDAYKWYQSKLHRLLEQGVDAFKTDFGERIPVDVKYYDGSDPERMHNFYAYLYNKCVFEVIEAYKGKNEAVVFARSATAGCQKFPVHWGGDCFSTYISMRDSLRAGLSLCLSGFAFWSHDIGGFEGTACADI
jgi:alpha-D-xyloside xylohydrolase